MARCAVYVRLMAAVLFGALFLAVLPSDAAAHASLVAEPSVNFSLDEAEDEAHCHGAVECVVTFFMADPAHDGTAPPPKPRHVISVDAEQGGLTFGRDPPIPIRVG